MANDGPEKLADLRREQGLEYPLLVDPGAATIRAYGLLNEAHGGIPHPAALVIDGDGVIRYLRVDENYRVRPAPEELLTALRSLEQSAP